MKSRFFLIFKSIIFGGLMKKINLLTEKEKKNQFWVKKVFSHANSTHFLLRIMTAAAAAVV